MSLLLSGNRLKNRMSDVSIQFNWLHLGVQGGERSAWGNPGQCERKKERRRENTGIQTLLWLEKLMISRPPNSKR